MFKLGSCPKMGCGMPFHMVPSIKTEAILDIERYSPPFPARLLNESNDEREKHVCEALFSPDELKFENGLYVVGKNVSDPLLIKAARVLRNRGKPGNLDSFDVGGLSSDEVMKKERTKFVIHSIQHNFNKQSLQEFDSYFNILSWKK